MRSTNRGYLPAVDHLRAVAAVMVLVYHGGQLLRDSGPPGQPHPFNPTTDWVYTRNPAETVILEGHSGVALFMVLSAFILTVGSLGRPVHCGRFLHNRVLRIVPMYVLLLFVAIVLAPGGFSLLGILQTVLGFQHFPGGFDGGAASHVLWTIGVEFQFYLLFPLLLRLLNERGPLAIARLVAAVGAVRLLGVLTAPRGVNLNSALYFSIVGRFDQFLIGMLAAVAYTRYRRQLARWPLVLAAALGAVAMLWTFNQLHGYAQPAVWRSLWVDVAA